MSKEFIEKLRPILFGKLFLYKMELDGLVLRSHEKRKLINDSIEEVFAQDNTDEFKGCGKELGNCKCGESCNICDGEVHLCEECQNKKFAEDLK